MPASSGSVGIKGRLIDLCMVHAKCTAWVTGVEQRASGLVTGGGFALPESATRVLGIDEALATRGSLADTCRSVARFRQKFVDPLGHDLLSACVLPVQLAVPPVSQPTLPINQIDARPD